MKISRLTFMCFLIMASGLAKAALPNGYDLKTIHKLGDGSFVAVGGSRPIVGNTYQNNLQDFMVIKFKSNGSLDKSFETDGVRLLDVSGDQDQAGPSAILNDGKILVYGSANIPSPSFPMGQYDIALARLTPSGTLDASFGTNGFAMLDISTQQDNAANILVQPDGKIIAIAGSYLNNATEMEFAVARFNANGSLDTSFNSGAGFITTSLGPFQDEPSSALLQPDGKIVVSGISNRGGQNYDFAAVRFNANGALDGTFGAGGVSIH
ncbi:MAG: delta-60 repeat domain-containing protein [Thiobacillus sp.]